jgi:hypothetical protein
MKIGSLGPKRNDKKEAAERYMDRKLAVIISS